MVSFYKDHMTKKKSNVLNCPTVTRNKNNKGIYFHSANHSENGNLKAGGVYI